ncbi:MULTISPECIES: flagellar filament capping protein FliD [unclassified Burkholderia]|uniref:flagellar filament capping protein FliD n=1 Tax=unclassified Burkholderia TaxID=2613784 RepID=UPI0014204AD1|nr:MULTISPECIES: flagellar filament capping protein FliD [unclassified Burkholderia]NIF73386.1 flagellar filament capping protein FliD [Burkholderia sp. Ap-962]NIF92112.1 flagellar filament capping protein FliD [Burkholderia sp. Cy-637]
MSTIPSTSNSSSNATTSTSQSSNNALNSNQALQEAAQSIISGSTGNTGLDVNTLVSALVNSKVAAQGVLLSTSIANDNLKNQAYASLQSALSTLQTSLASLADGSLAQTYTATATGNGLTASAGVGAQAGTYQVTVSQIAQSQSLSSPAFGATTQLGTGSLTLQVGTKSSTINISSSNNTLAGIKDAINNDPNNPGVSATIVNGTDGAHLVLSSKASGAANTINVTANASTDNGLSQLSVTSTPSTSGGGSSIPSTSGWSQSTAAQDAQYKIGSVSGSSATNTITGAIAGVTLNLTQAAVSNPPAAQTLTIAADTTTQASTITAFVKAYNTLVTTYSAVGTFNSSNPSQSGPLFGDSTLNSIQNQLSAILGGGVTNNGASATLKSLGITIADGTNSTQPAGTLVIDQGALTTALQSTNAAATLFNGTNGIGEQLNKAITNITAPKGILTTSVSSVQSDLTSLTSQQTTLNAYAAQLTTQYNTQFTQLNTLLAQMTTNQNYLTQLFGGTNSAGALATNK